MDNPGLQPPILNSLPTPPMAAVPIEEPQIVKPRGKFGQTVKKHGVKFLMGGLLTLVLGAGIWLEVQVVQQKQQVESQAGNDEPKKYCTGAGRCKTNPNTNAEDPALCSNDDDCEPIRHGLGCPNDTVLQCGPVDASQGHICFNRPPGMCKNLFPSQERGNFCPPDENTCMLNCSCCPPEKVRTAGEKYNYTYTLNFDGAKPSLLTQCKEPNDEYLETTRTNFNCINVYDEKICQRTNVCRKVTCEKPPASPVPSASPIVTSTISCTDLTSNVAAPNIGQTATFTCKTNFSGITKPLAFFRYSKNNAATWTEPTPQGISLNAATKAATHNITINQAGNWVVQCRVCGQNKAVSLCTNWGEASGNTWGLE